MSIPYSPPPSVPAPTPPTTVSVPSPTPVSTSAADLTQTQSARSTNDSTSISTASQTIVAAPKYVTGYNGSGPWAVTTEGETKCNEASLEAEAGYYGSSSTFQGDDVRVVARIRVPLSGRKKCTKRQQERHKQVLKIRREAHKIATIDKCVEWRLAGVRNVKMCEEFFTPEAAPTPSVVHSIPPVRFEVPSETAPEPVKGLY